MTNRYVTISKFDNEFVISCYNGHCNDPIHSWTTNRLECIPVITRLWIEFGAKEEKIEKVLEELL